MKKRLAFLLAMVMVVTSITACGGNKKNDSAKDPSGTGDTPKKESSSTIDTMVIGVVPLDGIFSPLFYTSAYDNQVNDLIFTPICRLDENGEVIDWAGHVESEEVKTEDDKTQIKYTVTVQKDMKFSDGEPVTIDDVLFYYYVMADPTYDGMSTFSTLDIVGMKEYYYDTPDYTKIIKEIEDKYSLENISKEDYVSYLVATNLDGWFDGTLPGDVDGAGKTWADYLKDNGYDASKIDKPEDMLAMLADCEYEKFKENYDPFTYYKKQAVLGSLEDGIDVDKISGIERVDDYTCTVLFNSPNISGDKLVAWHLIMPEHYYGKDWSKGNLANIKTLNQAPLGSGPYIFNKYENNIVSLDANPNYFKGEPMTPHVKVQVVNEEDKVDLVMNGDVDITDPSASLEIIELIDADPNVEKSLVDNPGYGYIGINAERVPDVNVRKGLMHLMNRAPAIKSYYGELGNVIERPMTPTLAEYPKDAKEYYGYDTEKALEFFKKAGYEQKNGKLVKDGKQLKINATIGDAKSHPNTPILTQMANDMEKMGAELVVNDVEFNVLSTKVQGGEVDMWVMAWGNATDCDLTQMFGSKGGSNHQRYYSDKLDKIQAEILQTLDFDERCKLVAEELDMIMDAAVYMPVYQRKNMEIYNATNVNISTLPENTTTYWNYVANIETLEMN